jgi:hypothetical protein
MTWKHPEAGEFAIAIPSGDCATTVGIVEGFFGRELAHYTYGLSYKGQSYAIFFFVEEADADLAVAKFNGEPFDIRDKGRGQQWMKWFKGRAEQRERNRGHSRWS